VSTMNVSSLVVEIVFECESCDVDERKELPKAMICKLVIPFEEEYLTD
jgi:hypothetical protein